MAGLDGQITIGTAEYRPCIVTDKKHTQKALFHRWEDFATTRDAILTYQAPGQIRQTFGIVEYEDGTVHRCYPENIRFCDNKLKEYCIRGNVDTREKNGDPNV